MKSISFATRPELTPQFAHLLMTLDRSLSFLELLFTHLRKSHLLPEVWSEGVRDGGAVSHAPNSGPGLRARPYGPASL